MKKISVIFLLLAIFSSCSTVKQEINLSSQKLNSPITSDKSRVIFFNTSNKILYSDGSWRIGIKLNGKGLANLDFDEYVLIDLTPGKYSLELSHIDIFTFRDLYYLDVIDQYMYIEVYNEITSTDFNILPNKPEDFENKYSPMN